MLVGSCGCIYEFVSPCLYACVCVTVYMHMCICMCMCYIVCKLVFHTAFKCVVYVCVCVFLSVGIGRQIITRATPRRGHDESREICQGHPLPAYIF